MLKAHQTLRNTRLIQVEPDLEFSWKKDLRLLHRATVYPVFRHHVLLNHRNFLQTDKHFTSTAVLSDLERKYLVHRVLQPQSSSFVPTSQGPSLWVMSNLSIFQNAKLRRICAAELKHYATHLQSSQLNTGTQIQQELFPGASFFFINLPSCK